MIQWYHCINMNYITTNIRLPEEDYLRLKEEAAKKRTSFASVIREKVGKKKPAKDFAKMLLGLNTDWFTQKDYKEYKRNRAQLKKRAKTYNW